MCCRGIFIAPRAKLEELQVRKLYFNGMMK
jgi:hypothetical protein